MALRRIIPMMSLWLAFSACFHGCDWSDTTESESKSYFIEILIPPNAVEAVITLGSSPAQTVKIGEEDVDLRIIPVEEDLGKTNLLLVQFKDSFGNILCEEIREVYVSNSGQTRIDLQLAEPSEAYIIAYLAEFSFNLRITVRGWNFSEQVDLEIYLEDERIYPEDDDTKLRIDATGSFETSFPVTKDILPYILVGDAHVHVKFTKSDLQVDTELSYLEVSTKLMANPGFELISADLKVTVEAFPGGGDYGDPSYFDARLEGDGAVVLGINGTSDAFCVDTDHSMVAEKTYTIISVYSSHLNLPEGLVEFPENLDLVNYILNQAYIGKSSPGGYGTYTYGDVQRAIWELLEDQQSDAGLGEWTLRRVDGILKDAKLNGEGFVPGKGGNHTLILVPVDENGTIRQIFLIVREPS
jgi:hypothetical protein